jgi:hypothetical protein
MHLADGRRVSGRIEADSPIRDASVRYSGHTQLLPFRCQAANSLVLRALFRSFAEDLKAQYQEVLVEKRMAQRRSAKSNRRHGGTNRLNR